MAIELKCAECGKSYQLKDSLAGKRVKCKCGCSMAVPTPPAAADDPLGLGDAGLPGPLGDLLDSDLPSADGTALPAVTLSATPVPMTTAGTTAKKKVANKKKPEGMSNTATGLMVAGFIISVIAVMGIVLLLVRWSVKTGFETPEAAFAAHQQSLIDKNWAAQIQTFTPAAQRDLAFSVTWYAADKMGTRKEIKQSLEDHGLTSAFSTEALSDREAARQSFVVEDVVKCYDDMVKAIDAAAQDRITNPVLRAMERKAKGESRREKASAELKDLTISGDTANGTILLTLADGDTMEDPVTFRRIDGRWFIELSSDSGFGDLFLGLGAVF